MLLRAARFGELDNMRGVSANVMCGQEGYYGTSAFQVLFDTDTYIQSILEDTQGSVEDTMNNDKPSDITTDLETDTTCNVSNIIIHNSTRSVKAVNVNHYSTALDF